MENGKYGVYGQYTPKMELLTTLELMGACGSTLLIRVLPLSSLSYLASRCSFMPISASESISGPL